MRKTLQTSANKNDTRWAVTFLASAEAENPGGEGFIQLGQRAMIDPWIFMREATTMWGPPVMLVGL